MKKLSIIILALAMIAIPASAQLKWGISGGLNVNKVSLDDELFDSSNRLGWFIGPKAEFSLPVLPLAINGAVYYAQTSAKVSQTDRLTEMGEASITQKTIQVPINAKWNIGLGETASFYLAAGPQFDFNVGDKNTDIEFAGSKLGSISTKSNQLSFNIGAGVNLLSSLELGVVYNVPCSNSSKVYEGYKETDSGKNQTWKVMATIFF